MKRIRNFYQYALINESVLELSKVIVDLLKSIKQDPIASKLLKLWSEKKDLDFINNFIDITDAKDAVYFTPEKRIRELLGQIKPEDIIYEFKHNTKNLKYNPENEINMNIFNKLGFTSKDNKEPYQGTRGKIKSEYKSKSGKTWALFVAEQGNPPKENVVNRESLIEVPTDAKAKIWSMKNRNSIKIGRIARSILETDGEKVLDKDIEIFVNSFKSAFDIMNNSFARLELVTGDDIAYWYSSKNYENTNGRIGSSCMSRVDEKFFGIYTQNPAISMLILYSEGGKIENGRYRSDKICGRATVWQTDEGDIFMDNVYSCRDSDVNLFNEFAEKNGWFHASGDFHSRPIKVTNGTITKRPVYIVSLKKSDFERYPHPDVFEYLNFADKKLCTEPVTINADRYLGDTSGGYTIIVNGRQTQYVPPK